MYFYQIIVHTNPWVIYLHDGRCKRDLMQIDSGQMLVKKRLIPIGGEPVKEDETAGERTMPSLLSVEIINDEGNSKTYEFRDVRITKREGVEFSADDIRKTVALDSTLLWVIDHQHDSSIRFDVELDEPFDIDRLSLVQRDYFAGDTTFPYDDHFVDAEHILYDGKPFGWLSSIDHHSWVEADLFEWREGREGDILFDSTEGVLAEAETDYLYDELMPPKAM